MDVETPTINGASAGPGATGLTPALMEMLRGGGVSGLGLLLANAQLTTEQRALVDVLQTLQSDGSTKNEPNEEATQSHVRGRSTQARSRQRRRHEEIDAEEADDTEPSDAVERELADLREVNDTLAAALGACRVCWGGDDHCPICQGDGHSGAEEPNAALFEALVVPAVRRMRTRRPMRSHMASGPHRE